MSDPFLDRECRTSPPPYECELLSPGPVCRMPDEGTGMCPPSPCEGPLASDSFSTDETAVDYLLWQISPLSMKERLECTGRRLLGTPYAVDPLGEGSYDFIDKDPLYSFEALDCMTYVEEVMAISSGASDFGSFISRLGSIRYLDGQHFYGMRNHFVSADWLPANEEAGFVRDITGQIGAGELEYASLTIDRIAWISEKDIGLVEKAAAMYDLHAIGKDAPEYVVMHYIPLSALYTRCGDDFVANQGVIAALPDISVALLVRPQEFVEKYGTIVAHMGFLVFAEREDGSRGELMFRHGSSKSGTITEEPFFPYIDSQKRYRAGVVILEILK